MSLVSRVIVLLDFSAPSNHENELIWYWTVVQGITTSDLSPTTLFRGEVDSKAGLIISPEVGHNRRKMYFKYYCTVIFFIVFLFYILKETPTLPMRLTIYNERVFFYCFSFLHFEGNSNPSYEVHYIQWKGMLEAEMV